MIEQKTIFSNFIWRFLERCGAQLITFIVSIVLARILDPVVYGTVAIVTVITSILQVFVDSGLGNALIQKKNADDTDFSTVFYFNIGVCTLLYLILFFVAPLIASIYEMPELTDIVRVLGLTLIISGVKNVQQAYVSKNMLFKKFFFSTLGGSIASGVVGVLMAIWGYGVWALVAQTLANLAIGTIVLWLTVKWRPKWVFSWQRLKGLFSYGWKLLTSALIDTVYNNIRPLIIGYKYTAEDLSYYNKGKQFPNLIVTNVNSSIDSVLLPAISKEQDDKSQVKRMMRRAIKTSSFIMWPLMVGLGVCAEPLIRLLLTEKWLFCVPYLRIFWFTYAFYPIHTANLNAIKAIGRSDVFLKLEIAKKVVGMALLLSSIWFGVMAMAYTLLISAVVSSFINAFPNRKFLGYGYLEQIKDILPSIILSAVMGVAVFFINFIPIHDVLKLCIQVPLGAAIYIVGAKVFKFESFTYILNMVKNLFRRKKTKPNPKKLLIIGANPETISLIEKSKAMGIKTYVTDYEPKAYAKKFADVPCNVDGMDVDGMAELVKKEKIGGVLVGVAEALVPSYCKLCERLNYPCFATLDQFEIMIKKDKFKSICREYGVPVVEEYDVNNLDAVIYPAVVKPVDSCSSKGVSICNNKEELDLAIEKALSFSRSKKVLIEKYMAGLEVVVYYVIQEGESTLVAMCDRYTSKEQVGVTQLPSAYIFPSRHLDGYIKDVDEKVKNMLKGLNVQNGVLFLQGFVDNGSVVVYEPGFRLNGAQEHMIVSKISGIDAKELLINFALSGKMSDKKVSEIADPTFGGKWACKLSPLAKLATVSEIKGVDEIKKNDKVISVNMNYEPGRTVSGLGTQRQMIANIFTYADTKEELIDTIRFVNENFDVLDENGESILLKPFDPIIILEDYKD